MSPVSPGAQRLNTPQHTHIQHLLMDWAVRTPNAPALLVSGRLPLTYGRLYRHITGVVRRLRAVGVGHEDRVALLLPMGPEMAVAFLAVAVGAVCAPLNPAYSTDELDSYLANLDAKAMIIQSGMETPARGVAQARGLNLIELSPTLDAEAGLFTLAGAGRPYAGNHDGFTQPDDVALVLPTSGTTSQPKIVPLTHINICTVAHNIRVILELSESDRCLNVLPPFHVHALLVALLTSMVAGASCVCSLDPSPTAFFASMVAFRPTWYTAVPTVHQAILASAAQNHEAIESCPLRFIRSASAPLPKRVLTDLERVFKAPVIEAYGMTETGAQITSNLLPPRLRKAGSVGVAAGPEVAIMSPEGAILPTGDIGEIVVRGPTIFQGYENDPTINKHAFTDGWFRTGDEGFWDSDGYLFITGRLQEIINRGGEKIVPQEVDNVLMEHPAVARAVTFAVPHARLGEDIAAAVMLHQNVTATEHDIRLFAAARLAAFKVPQQVYIVEDLPKSSTGKLQRFGMAEKLNITTAGQIPHTLIRSGIAPRTPVEEWLAGLWAQTLGLDRVGIHDNFFQLGGDSILATQLISRIREVMHVEVSFRSFFENPTVGSMATNIEISRRTVARPPESSLQPVPRDGVLPLSYTQQGLWFLEQLESSRAVYNLPLAWRLTGILNVSALERSLGEIMRRHDALRTSFPSVNGQPVQVVAPDTGLPLPVVDLQTLPATERETAAHRLTMEKAKRPFDLAHGPLVRAVLLRLTDRDHILLLTLHHMIFDGWSTEVFWQELATFYTAICTGQPLSLPDLPCQYADYAVWQREWLREEILEAQLAYWEQQLANAFLVLELPTDRPRPSIQTFQGARQSQLLPESLTTALKTLSQREEVTLFMTLVAAFQTLLYRYTGQTDLVVGTPIAGRTRVKTEGLLGFFANTLILRINLSDNPRFRELLRQVREVTLGAYDHQDLPFEKLVESLQPVRDLSRHPLVQVMIVLQPSTPSATGLPGLTVCPVAVDSGTAKFDLTLSLQDIAQGLLATVEYNTDLFNPTTITRMLGHFQTLLEGIIADPEQRLANLPLLTATERHQLLMKRTTTSTDYPQDSCLHTLFEAQAERMPDTVAVVCNGQQLTYDALNRRANQLAHYLRTLGVGPEVCVGLCVERSLEMVVGLLGILKAGGAYVPLDPMYPKERLAVVVADARLSVLVTQQLCLAVLPASGAQLVCLDTDWEQMARQRTANPAYGVEPENLAYVLYTSGSTGAPKGVMVEHRSVLAFLHGFERVAPSGEGHIGTTVCPLGFDVSVWECFSMLCFGGTLHILLLEAVTDPRQFARYLVDQGITNTYIPPALLADVARSLEQQEPLALRRLLVGVEPIPQGVLQHFRNLCKHMHIVNGYGPTEATVCATLFPFRAAIEPDRRAPIGTPIPGYDVYLVDANVQPVPIGIPGELLIGGTGLARGYINHPEFTAECFIANPFSQVPEARLYKTGDLARYLPDGNLEFLGRLDNQVKLRGYRIEPGEIEAALRQHPAVREAMVLVQEEAHRGDDRLIAYLVTHREAALEPRVLRTFLKQKLPEFMLPSAFVMLDALPRTPNGKLDHQALPMPDIVSSSGTATFVAPRTSVERTLASIWADVLRLERIGVHDNFFELGGDSILSIQIIARAHQAALRITPKQLFQYQTIAELSMVANTGPAIHSEQGAVIGPVPLTPVQQWFFEQAFCEPHHWNQARLLDAELALNPLVLEEVVRHLLVHHDMLRARFKWDASNWQQNIAALEKSPVVVCQDLSVLSEVEQAKAIEAVASECQSSLNLADGPLIRVVLFSLSQHKYTRLLVVIHHLVVDSISWQILLADLQLAYQQRISGQAIQLPAKTTSFKHWAEQLAIYAQSDALREERSFWLVVSKRASRIPVDYREGANTVASARMVSVSLSPEETRILLNDVPHAYQTRINDVLLTALAQGFTRWTGASTLLIDIEGHGREDITSGLNLSRTVGWFTTIFPVLLQIEQATQPSEVLKSVKEHLRAIPNRGIGYGLLRYLCQDTVTARQLQALPQAEVSFNYLGPFDQMLSEPALFRLAPTPIGPQHSPRGRRHYLLEITGRTFENQLHFDWIYSEQVHRYRTIYGLAQDFMEALRILIAHCQSSEAGGYTPSDFPTMNLNQQELDDLMVSLGVFVKETRN